MTDAAIYRYTVRAPAARERAIRDAARRIGVDPGHLVQMLFDRLNVGAMDHITEAMRGAVAAFVRDFRAIDVHGREHMVRAAAAENGLSVKTLRVMAAICEAAGGGMVCRSNEAEIGARARLADCHVDDHLDALMTAGWIAPVHGVGRERRAWTVLRAPTLPWERVPA